MSKFEIIMPKMGESVIEATITKWLKVEGDSLEEDDAIVEIATDKVDSEIPSPVEGKLIKTLFNEGDVVAVGTVIAIVEIKDDDDNDLETEAVTISATEKIEKEIISKSSDNITTTDDFSKSQRFYSPLVKSIAKEENVDLQELEKITGTGKDGRVTKRDILLYIKNRGKNTLENKLHVDINQDIKDRLPSMQLPSINTEKGDQIVEMDRMRKIIADHMVQSKQISAHVTSFIDVDVTNIVTWRNKIKDKFLKREGEKITFTPIFLYAAAQAIKEYPQVNVSLDGYNIIYRKNINMGMATALPNGNLIVPVIKNIDEKSLLGVVKSVNDLATRARKNALQPDEIQGGTFTMTNFGSFDSLTGTPIINQPQVAILGVGAIRKKPVVLETNAGDVIAIRHIMLLSLAYDHRIVDGALGGLYIKKVKEILENWELNKNIF